jgi:hypothetical protein
MTTILEDDTQKEVVNQKSPRNGAITPSTHQQDYKTPDMGIYYDGTPESHHIPPPMHDGDYAAVGHDTSSQKKRRKVFGCIPVWLCVALIVGILLAAGLGVGLYFGLKKKYVYPIFVCTNKNQTVQSCQW